MGWRKENRHKSSNSIYFNVHDQIILNCIAGAQIDPCHTVNQTSMGHEKCTGDFGKFLLMIKVIVSHLFIYYNNKLLVPVCFIFKYYM